jgi:NADH-quinone oxidoreductase subunit D
MAELTRISNHMLNLGSHIMDVGAMTPNLWLFECARTRCNSTSGVGRADARQLLPRRRRPPGHSAEVLPTSATGSTTGCSCSRTRSAWSPTTASSSSATSTSASVSKDDAIAWGFSGPMIRAAGMPWDMRKSQPYEVYDRMDFDIPVGTNGDCYDRFMVRVEEVRQSWKIARQCLKEMPSGPIGADQQGFPPARPR